MNRAMWIMLPIVMAAVATVVVTPVLARRLVGAAMMGYASPVTVALVAIPLYAAFFVVFFAFTSRVRRQAPELPEPLYDEPEAKGQEGHGH